MITTIFSRILFLPLIASAPLLFALRASPHAQPISLKDAALLEQRFDPALESLRAGRVAAPAPLAALERAQLALLQQNSTPLSALRAGAGPSEQEWTWLAIGAGIVLLAILL